MRTFKETKNKYNLTNINFPYSKIGIRVLGIIKKQIFIIIGLLFILVISSPITNGISQQNEIQSYKKSDADILDVMIEKLEGQSNSNKQNIKEVVLQQISMGYVYMLKTIINITLILTAILIFIYIAIMHKRHLLFERSVLKNDLESLYLKRKIIRIMDLKYVVKKLKQSSNKEINKSDQDKLEALTKVLKMDVTINTRETIHHGIEKIYNIFIEKPLKVDSIEEFTRIVEKISPSATMSLKNRVYFGEKRLTNKGDFYFQSKIELGDDPYYFTNRIKELKEIKASYDYEHTMPYKAREDNGISYVGLKDHSKENQHRKEKASEWAESQIEIIESYLLNNDLNVTFQKSIIQSKTVEFIYSIPEQVKIKGVSNIAAEIANKIDEVLFCNGTIIKITSKNVLVTVPLPNGQTVNGIEKPDYRQMINSEDILRKAFG